VPEAEGLSDFNEKNIDKLEGVIEYEKANASLYEFVGKLIVNNRE
jgi:hypothetical protein